MDFAFYFVSKRFNNELYKMLFCAYSLALLLYSQRTDNCRQVNQSLRQLSIHVELRVFSSFYTLTGSRDIIIIVSLIAN